VTRVNLLDQPISDDALTDAAARHAKRLETHLTRMDGGDRVALDDLVTVLRTLIVPGRGGKLIERLVTRYQLETLPVFVGAETPSHKNTWFALGNVPLAVGAAPDDPHARELTFRAWVESTAIRSAQTSRSKHEWSRLVSDYGNTWSSHVGTTVPALLSSISMMGFAGTDLGTHLLRKSAVVTEIVLGALLRQLDFDVNVPERSLNERSTWPVWIDTRADRDTVTHADLLMGLAEELEPHIAICLPLPADGVMEATVGENRAISTRVRAKFANPQK